MGGGKTAQKGNVMKKLTGKEIAIKTLDKNSKERKEAEKMMGIKLEEMTKEQKTIAIACLEALQDFIK